MAFWAEDAAVITHGTLLTFVRNEGYFELATTTAVASLSLTGDPRVYSETATIASISSVSTTDFDSVIGNVTNPSFTSVGTGFAGGIGQGAAVLPLPIVVAGTFKAGTIINPLPIVSGAALPSYSSIANLMPPPPTVIGQLYTGVLITGSVQAPLAQVNVISGDTASVQPSAPVVAAVGFAGIAGTGVVNNIPAQVVGVLSQETLTIGAVIPSSPIVSGEMLQGTLNIGDVQNRISVISGIGVSGGISTGAVIPPLFDANAAFISEIISVGEIILPLPIVRGTILVVLANSVTWVLNTENNQMTNYTQFPFTALGLLGTNPVGATADGLYLLTGDNDDGQFIDSVFKFGMTDFRSELVDNADVYVGGDIESDMEVSIREDGQEAGNAYTLSERERHVRGHRAKLGKGFRSRYREISISNVNGGNFELDSLSLSSRDLRGNE